MATATAVSRIRNQPQRFGQLNARVLDITLGTYTTNGEALTLSQLGFGVGVYGISVIGFATAASAQATSVTVIKPDVSSETAPKLVCFTGATTQVTNATDLSAIVVRCIVWGL